LTRYKTCITATGRCFRSLRWTLNAVVHRCIEPLNDSLFWLHIQVYWRICCISEYNQRGQTNL